MEKSILEIANAIQQKAQLELENALADIKVINPEIFCQVHISIFYINNELMPENLFLVKCRNPSRKYNRYSNVDNRNNIKNVSLFSKDI